MSKKNLIDTKEKNLISRFLLNLSEKNFSTANKTLKKIIESKLNKRVLSTINNS